MVAIFEFCWNSKRSVLLEQHPVAAPQQSLCAEMAEELCLALRCQGSRQTCICTCVVAQLMFQLVCLLLHHPLLHSMLMHRHQHHHQIMGPHTNASYPGTLSEKQYSWRAHSTQVNSEFDT